MIINMGPQHPSTHGVLRLVLELDGEYVVSCRPVIGYLHTGIEKNTEYRTWQQGVTFVTRADYLSPFFNETAYCLAVERLLGIEAPPRAQVIRVMVMELNRIASHLMWLATTGLELGVTGPMLRAAGVAWDLRKDEPYCGYETYDFDVPLRDAGDCFARYEVRLEEMGQSLRIVEQCLDRLAPGPVMIEDPKLRWP